MSNERQTSRPSCLGPCCPETEVVWQTEGKDRLFQRLEGFGISEPIAILAAVTRGKKKDEWFDRDRRIFDRVGIADVNGERFRIRFRLLQLQEQTDDHGGKIKILNAFVILDEKNT